MQTNHQEEQTYGGQSFAPRDFNARTQEPEAAEGEYTVTIQNAKFRVTPPDRGSDPQVNMQLKITATASDDEAADKSIGGTLFDAITFFAPGSRSRLSNMHKRRYLDLLEACGLEEDIMPATIKSPDDFEELIGALKGKELTVWVSHTPRADGQGVYVNVSYTAPRGRASEDEAPAEEERPRARQAAPAKGGSKNGAKQTKARR